MIGTQASMEMPRYKCHKKVRALKIKRVELLRNGDATIVPDDDRYAPFRVDSEYVKKHKPLPDGYYVVSADGYKSWSPAEAFEDGYTLVG